MGSRSGYLVVITEGAWRASTILLGLNLPSPWADGSRGHAGLTPGLGLVVRGHRDRLLLALLAGAALHPELPPHTAPKAARKEAERLHGPLTRKPFLLTDEGTSFLAKRFTSFIKDDYRPRAHPVPDADAARVALTKPRFPIPVQWRRKTTEGGRLWRSDASLSKNRPE